MNFGYLIIVSQSENTDYLKLAYSLATSIKNTQKKGYDRVALVIDDASKLYTSNVFDEVIEWNQETFWNGRSWMDLLSPWSETVCLDADMIFTRDYSHWIDYFYKNCDLYVTNKAYTYRNEKITSDEYRKAFTRNNLPNLYSMWSWFKKDKKIVSDFFELVRLITKNPKEFSNNFLSEYKPKIMGTDEAFALSAKILGIDDQISYDLEFPKIVHMKGMVQNWPWPADKVTDHVGFYLDREGEIKIGNFQQPNLIHYVEKNLITNEFVKILEDVAWKKN